MSPQPAKNNPYPRTVYMPCGFEDAVWLPTPQEWLPDLIRRKAINDDGCVKFYVATILGTVTVRFSTAGWKVVSDQEIPRDGDMHIVHDEGEVIDVGDSLDEILSRMGEWITDDDDCNEWGLFFLLLLDQKILVVGPFFVHGNRSILNRLQELQPVPMIVDLDRVLEDVRHSPDASLVLSN